MSDSSEPEQELELDEDAHIDVEHIAPTENENANPGNALCLEGNSDEDFGCEVKDADTQDKYNAFDDQPLLDEENALGPEETEMVKRALLR